MSDSRDAKNARTTANVEASLRSAAGGRLWSGEDFERAANFGLTPANIFVEGDRFALSGVQQYSALGFANTSPDPQLGLTEYLGASNESLESFQTRTAALPLIFNNDGTATFAPSAQKQTFSYVPKDPASVIVPALFAAFAGAGLTGLLPGTTSVFTGAAAGAGGSLSITEAAASGIFQGAGGAAVGSAGMTAGNIIAGATAGAGAAGLLAENSFDSGAMQSVLERTSSTVTLPSATSLINGIKTAATVASATGTIVQSAAIIDSATGGSEMPKVFNPTTPAGTFPAFIENDRAGKIFIGDIPVATKTASATPAATPAASSFNLQSLLPIAVLVVAVLALSGEFKGE